jgi:hypothetical protein
MTQHIEIDGQRLVANCDPELDHAAQSLLAGLARMNAAGPKLKPGSLVDFGWAMLRIETHGDHWVVCEPDYDSDPLDWKPQVDETVWVSKEQAELHASLPNVPIERTRGDQQIHFVADALSADAVYLHRLAPDGAQDSGWFVGTEADFVARVPAGAKTALAGELISVEPDWASVLILPVGFSARFEQGRLAAILDARRHQVYPRS